MRFLKNFIDYVTTPSATTPPPAPPRRGPLTEGKTRGNVKPHEDRPRPTAAPAAPKPKKTKCKWIEVYVPDFQDSRGIDHHDNAKFREEPNGHLTVDKALGLTIVYRNYSKYVVHEIER